VFGVVMPAWCVMVRCGILTYFMLCVCGKGVYVCMSARKV
jgi:hypothetical protein